ncbi:cytochrome c-type biogenesis protein [Caballeronia sp.]|uniref:cytochrome c-type biogenesis protein n=1 Tax=Caballeronia sp. TaxID=1931223 RepID=UPI003C55D67B
MNSARVGFAVVLWCAAGNGWADSDCFPGDLAGAGRDASGGGASGAVAVEAAAGSGARASDRAGSDANGRLAGTVSAPVQQDSSPVGVAQPVDQRVAQRNQARIHALESSFRCVVCQNETIADSTADLAADLRAKIVEQVAQGISDEKIRAYMVTRYGDFILYDPPFKPLTWLLWLGPFALLMLGFAVLMRIVARRRAIQPSPLTDLQRQRARHLLGDDR